MRSFLCAIPAAMAATTTAVTATADMVVMEQEETLTARPVLLILAKGYQKGSAFPPW